MSFILDALRKSEHERRMETAPDIMHAPTAVARTALPAWSILLIAALVAALIAVSLFSVFQRSDFADAENPAAGGPRAAAPLPAADGDVTAGGTADDDMAFDNDTAQRVADDTAAAPPQTVVNPPPAATAAQPAPQIDAAPRIDPARLPQYAAVVAEGLPVGALQMQLHVHSSAAASRFVVINGTRRREGERLNGGVVVEQIVPEGAVLSYEGRRFLLTPN